MSDMPPIEKCHQFSARSNNYSKRTGLKPPGQTNLLRAVPGWGLIGINHTGFSHDHSAQVELRRKYANGMSFQWFYTYVRALTTTDPGDRKSTRLNSSH